MMSWASLTVTARLRETIGLGVGYNYATAIRLRVRHDFYAAQRHRWLWLMTSRWQRCIIDAKELCFIIKLCGRPPQYAPAPCKLTFDLESGVQVTCDVGYLCTNFSLLRPLCSRLRPDVRDRQTSDVHHRLMPPTLRAGHNNGKKPYSSAAATAVIAGSALGLQLSNSSRIVVITILCSEHRCMY